MSKLKQWVNQAVSTLINSFKRFTLTMAITAAFVIVLIIQAHGDNDELFRNYIIALAVAMPVSGILELFYEMTGKIKPAIQLGITAVISIIYYLVLPKTLSDMDLGRVFAWIAICYAVFFCLFYFPRRRGFTVYLVERMGKFFLTALYAMVLYAGLNAVFFSIEALFELNFPSELPLDIFYCVFGFFGVPFFLGSFPKYDEQVQTSDYSKIFKTLFLFIMLPIQSVYTVILYAYFIRLLLMQTLPEGLIGNLVLWYALFSFFTLYLVQELREEKPWIKWYTKIFSALIVIPMGMLIVAFWIRISNYGLTASRYFSIMGILFLIVGYLLLPLERRYFAMVHYAFAVCLIAVSFFGVLSWDHVVLWDQNVRLENALESAGYTHINGELIPPKEISKEDKRVITNSVYYLTDLYEVEEIKALPNDFDFKNSEKVLGFEIGERYNYSKSDYFHEDFGNQDNAIQVSGYDYVLRLYKYGEINQSLFDESVQLKKDSESDQIDIIYRGISVGGIDLETLSQRAYETKDDSYKVTFTSSDQTSIEVEVRFVNVSGTKAIDGSEINFDSYDCWLMISKK